MSQPFPPDYNSLLDLFTQKQALRFSLREERDCCLISLGVQKLDISSMNRSVLKFINSAFFSTYRKNYYFQEFSYSPEFEMLLFARISIHYDDDVFSFYFYPNGAILNDFKDEPSIYVGMNIDELGDYYSTPELNKLLKKNPLKKLPSTR